MLPTLLTCWDGVNRDSGHPAAVTGDTEVMKVLSDRALTKRSRRQREKPATLRFAAQAIAGRSFLISAAPNRVTAARVGTRLLLLMLGLALSGNGFLQAQEGKPKVDAALRAATSGKSTNGEAPATLRSDLFGDPLPQGALVRMGSVRFARGDSIYERPVFAPDLKTFATVSNYSPYGGGRVVCLWDAASGKELWHIEDPEVEYFRVFFLNSANLVGTIGSLRNPVPWRKNGFVVRYWDAVDGKRAPDQLQPFDDPLAAWSGVSSLSSDENWLATAWQQPLVVTVRDRNTNKQLAQWKGNGDRVSCLAFAPDGMTLGICERNAIYFWQWKSDRQATRIGGLPEDAQSLRFSPDGRLAAASIYTEGLRVWETKGWSEVMRINGVSYDFRFLRDSHSLVALETGVIWDVDSGKKKGQFEDGAHIRALEFSKDGRSATGYALGRVRHWDVDTGRDRSTPELTVPRLMFHQIGFLPGGKRLVSASPDGAVRVWDATTGKELLVLAPADTWDNRRTFLRAAPDGTVVLARGDRLSFFKGDHKLEEHKLQEVPEEGLTSLNLSPDGKILILATGGTAKHRVEIWSVGTRKMVASFIPPKGTGLEALGVSSDMRIAAAVDRTVSLLNPSGTAIQKLDERPTAPRRDMTIRGGDDEGVSYFHGIQALTFAPEGDVLASWGHPGGGLKLLDVFVGKPLRVLVSPPRDTGHYQLRNAVFSPNGQMLAAESESGVVEVWEVSSGLRRRGFLGHRSYQTTLAFSSDGARLATGNRDATILVWDIFGTFPLKPPRTAPPTEAELLALWERLLDKDAERACLAMGRLMQWPDAAGAFLKRRLLNHKSPGVAQLRAWIADLNNVQFAKRDEATQELEKYLPAAEPLLKESLAANPSPEARRRLQSLQSLLESKTLAAETIRDLRALEVLEYLGKTALGELPGDLAKGDYDSRVVNAARAADRRLKALALQANE
jgi:WD40 repeat protein